MPASSLAQPAMLIATLLVLVAAPCVAKSQSIQTGQPSLPKASHALAARNARVLDIALYPDGALAVLARVAQGTFIYRLAANADSFTSSPSLDGLGVREAVALDVGPDGVVAVLDARGLKILRFQTVREGLIVSADSAKLRLAKASDLCATSEAVYVFGQQDALSPGEPIHVSPRNSSNMSQFGESFGVGGPIQRNVYNSGVLACNASDRMIIAASTLYPEVRAYDTTRRLRWATRLPNFLQVAVDVPGPGSMRFRLPADSVWDQVIAAVPLGERFVAVQVGRRKGISARSGFTEIRTYLLRRSDGKIRGSQQNLSTLIAATQDRLYVRRTHGPLTFEEVTYRITEGSR